MRPGGVNNTGHGNVKTSTEQRKLRIAPTETGTPRMDLNFTVCDDTPSHSTRHHLSKEMWASPRGVALRAPSSSTSSSGGQDKESREEGVDEGGRFIPEGDGGQPPWQRIHRDE